MKTAIANQNTQVTAGALGQLPTEEKNALQITLKTKGRLDDVKEFENIIIRSNTDGSNVRIKDIARVELGAESYSNLGLVNGKPSAVVVISQLPDANIINLSKAVKAKVEELNAKMTNGIKIMYVKDDAEYIQESMKEVEFTILLTGLIVVIIIYLFLGDAMATLVPCTMEEVGSSLVAMAMVLMAVFVPIIFMGGMTGVMYKQFAVCIAVSIAFSAICALSLSPAMCSHFLGHHKETEKENKHPYIKKIMDEAALIVDKFNEMFAKLEDFFAGFLENIQSVFIKNRRSVKKVC